ncbi:MAG: transglycosylase SLT domain-containing protein [Anaerovoracaceae bacterium]
MYKKLIAAVLTLAMVLCTWAPAFADTVPGSETLTGTEGSASETEGAATEENAETGTEESSGEDAELAEEDEDSSGDDAESSDEDTPEETEKEKAARLKAEKYRNGLASYMRKINPKMGKVWSRNLAQTFIDAGKKYDLDPKVLMALAQRESSFSSKATSPYGYKGMMQTSDGLARRYGYKPSSLYKAEVSIDVAARYLGGMKKEFGTYTKALSGYVYGGYAVEKGRYSTAPAKAILQTRREIKAYLEKYDFI